MSVSQIFWKQIATRTSWCVNTRSNFCTWMNTKQLYPMSIATLFDSFASASRRCLQSWQHWLDFFTQPWPGIWPQKNQVRTICAITVDLYSLNRIRYLLSVIVLQCINVLNSFFFSLKEKKADVVFSDLFPAMYFVYEIIWKQQTMALCLSSFLFCCLNL